MKIVISQPMFFPWIGIFEQIRLADIFVHYSDVQFSKGSFVNRVQIKTSRGIKWLTVPLEKKSVHQVINKVRISYQQDWRDSHINLLKQAYSTAPFRDAMLDIVNAVYSKKHDTIDSLSTSSMLAVCNYYKLDQKQEFINVEDLNIPGSSSERVLKIVQTLKGDCYITGHGANNYLKHDIFEDSGIHVEYMNYTKSEYPQLHGPFTPYVSILDLIANTGKEGIQYICSNTINWKDFVKNE